MANGLPRQGTLSFFICPAPVVMSSIKFLPGPLRKVEAQIIQFSEPGIQVIANAKVQGQPPRDLPVILEVQTGLPVSPVAKTGLKVGRFPAEDAGINACALAVGGVNRKKQWIEKVIRGTTEVRVAILDIPAEIDTTLQVVFAAVQRERIRIGINAFVKDFREFRYSPKPEGESSKRSKERRERQLRWRRRTRYSRRGIRSGVWV